MGAGEGAEWQVQGLVGPGWWALEGGGASPGAILQDEGAMRGAEGLRDGCRGSSSRVPKVCGVQSNGAGLTA